MGELGRLVRWKILRTLPGSGGWTAVQLELSHPIQVALPYSYNVRAQQTTTPHPHRRGRLAGSNLTTLQLRGAGCLEVSESRDAVAERVKVAEKGKMKGNTEGRCLDIGRSKTLKGARGCSGVLKGT